MRKSKQIRNDLEGNPKHKKQSPAHGKGGNGSKPVQESCPSTEETARDKKLKSALKRLERAVRAHPEEAANWFDLGRLLIGMGQNERAEEMLLQALRRAPDFANYRYYFGVALGNNGKFHEAAAQLKCLADIDPKLQDPISIIGLSALTDLGYCLGEMGHWKEAFATLQPATGVAISILGDLALFLSKAGKYDYACYLYSVALLLAPEDFNLLHKAGWSHMKAGRLQQARDHLQKAKKANPKDPDIWYDLGLALAMMRQGKEARPCFRRVLQLDPKHFWAWYDLACLDSIEKKPAAAFRNLYKSIECGFKDADYLLRDPDFKSIRKDPRWRMVIDLISDLTKSEAAARERVQ